MDETLEDQLAKLQFTPIPHNEIKIYYNENTGEIVSISVYENDEFKEYSIKVVTWNEGKDFLSGDKSPDQYFINIGSIRKEVVKKNLVQIAGHGYNFDYFDVLDFTIKSKDGADVIIRYNGKELTFETTKELYPMFLTMKKSPLQHLEPIDLKDKVVYKVGVPFSLFADMKYFRTLMIYYEEI